MNPRAVEYFFYIQRRWEEDLKIESIQSETSFGTTYYQYAMYLEPLLIAGLNRDGNLGALKEYREDGIVALMGGDSVVIEDTFDEAITALFEELNKMGLIE